MSQVALLVVSCDRYGDLWNPFFSLFFRYWADCPYAVYLGSNERGYRDPRVKPLLVGEDRDWSSNLAAMLAMLAEPEVLVMQEDFLLAHPVDTDRVYHLISYARRRGAACLRLMPIPGPDRVDSDQPEVGEILRGTQYRVSLQAAWWDKPVLRFLLREGESPWQFETSGSARADQVDKPFLSVVAGVGYPLDYFTTAVVRGYWEPAAIRLCRREGIAVDLRARRILPARCRFERALRARKFPAAFARVLAFPLGLLDKTR